jgi:hypothetical protein
MAETRTEKVTAVMTKSLRQDLAAYAEAHGWTDSTAAVNLIRQALEAEHRSHGCGKEGQR